MLAVGGDARKTHFATFRQSIKFTTHSFAVFSLCVAYRLSNLAGCFLRKIQLRRLADSLLSSASADASDDRQCVLLFMSCDTFAVATDSLVQHCINKKANHRRVRGSFSPLSASVRAARCCTRPTSLLWPLENVFISPFVKLIFAKRLLNCNLLGLGGSRWGAERFPYERMPAKRKSSGKYVFCRSQYLSAGSAGPVNGEDGGEPFFVCHDFRPRRSVIL